MRHKKIVAGDLLYHAVHGLCRLDRMIKQNQSGTKTLCYALVPKTTNKMKIRFVIAATDIEVSGFHGLISAKEANQILDYLNAGDGSTAVQTNQTWVLAQNILNFSSDKFGTRDQRKRKILEHSVKGLVGELACVLKMTLKETVARVQKNLGGISKINLTVLAALTHAAED